MRASQSFAVFLILQGISLQARAQAAPAEPLTVTHHYGLQNAGVDLVALGLGVAAVPLDSQGMMLTSVALFTFGSPIVHLAHQEPLKALGSFGLRAGLGGGGFFLALGLSNKGGFKAFEAGAIGLAIGAVAAVVIDDVFLAKKEMKVGPSLSFSPSYRPDRQEAMLNVSGAF
ncbi:MAG: hypothetical protein KBF88_02185 [Polyangiaceae bacterium]|nr:hypothetical protein [Polyangiaceae bacterium]